MPTKTEWADRIALLLSDLRADIAADAASASVIRVGLADNLADLIAQSDGTKTFSLPLEFRLSAASIDITKPCSLVGEVEIDGRASLEMPAPRFHVGRVRILAPDVKIGKVCLHGTNKDASVIEAGPATRLTQVAIDGGEAGVRRGVLVNSLDIVVDRCSVTNVFHQEDAQAICGWTGTKNLMVLDSRLEASGENIMFGGGDSASDSETPCDILIQRVHLSKPLTWRGKPGVTVKNLFELKNARRVKLLDSVLEGCWGGQGQSGYAVVLTVRNQYNAPWSTIEDVEIRGNTIFQVASGFQILGRDNVRASGRMTGLRILGNTLAVSPHSYSGRGDSFFVAGGPAGLEVSGNTITGDVHSFFYFDQPQWVCDQMVVTDNNAKEGQYGIFGSNAPGLGKAAIEMYAPGYRWERNTITRGGVRWITYPSGTTALAA